MIICQMIRTMSDISRPNTPWTWAFLIAALVQAVIILAIESYVSAEVDSGVYS
jgi:hypothetical protein